MNIAHRKAVQAATTSRNHRMLVGGIPLGLIVCVQMAAFLTELMQR